MFGMPILKRKEREEHDEYTNRTLDLSKVVTDSVENKVSKMQWYWVSLGFL